MAPSSPEHQANADHVHQPQGQQPGPLGLPVLARHEHDHDPEPERAVAVQLERVNGEPPLPGQQRLADGLAELGEREPGAGLAGQRAQRRRSAPKHASPRDAPDDGLAFFFLGRDFRLQVDACGTVTPHWQEKWLDDLEAEKRRLTFGPLDA